MSQCLNKHGRFALDGSVTGDALLFPGDATDVAWRFDFRPCFHGWNGWRNQRQNTQNWLVVWNMFLFIHIFGIIIPIDEFIFFRGVGFSHQPEKQTCRLKRCTWHLWEIRALLFEDGNEYDEGDLGRMLNDVEGSLGPKLALDVQPFFWKKWD